MTKQIIFGINRSHQREWHDTPYDGVSFCWLSENITSGKAAALRFEYGAKLPAHHHPGWEQIFILEGQFKINDQICYQHDFVFLPAGTRHTVEALTSGSYLTTAERDGVEIISASNTGN